MFKNKEINKVRIPGFNAFIDEEIYNDNRTYITSIDSMDNNKEDLVANSSMPHRNLDRKDYYNKLKTGQL